MFDKPLLNNALSFDHRRPTGSQQHCLTTKGYDHKTPIRTSFEYRSTGSQQHWLAVTLASTAGVPAPPPLRERNAGAASTPELLLRYRVAADAAAAAHMAANTTLKKVTPHTVARSLERLSFLGWRTEGISAQNIFQAGPKVVPRTAFCRAHRCVLLSAGLGWADGGSILQEGTTVAVS